MYKKAEQSVYSINLLFNASKEGIEVGENYALELKQITKRFGSVLANDHVDLTLRKSEILAILGENGSGKTTLMNIIGCMDKHTSGEVILDGINLNEVSKNELTQIRRDKIGMVFQQFHLIPYLTAVENLMVAQYYHSIPDKKEAMEALARVGLEDRAGHLPSELSGGEQQRVCIARALINYPVLILADEPTGNLDEKNEKLVMNLFRELNEEGHTIITVTHSDHVGKAAKRIVIIEHGHMREGGEEEKA